MTATAATIAITPARVPATIGTEEDTFGTVGSEFRVVVDAALADVLDCDIDVADDCAAVFIGGMNPILAGMESDVVFVELVVRNVLTPFK